MAEHNDYCEAFVRDADPERYFAALFAPSQYRAALFSLYAFDCELRRTHLVKEPMAGEIRLQWWHDVITGAGHSGGSPVATALIEAMAAFSLPENVLTGLIDAHRQALYPPDANTAGPDENNIVQLHAPVFELAMQILNDGSDPRYGNLCDAAGAAYGYARSGAPGAISYLESAGELLRQTPERLWAAFLHLALVPAMLRLEAIPQWRVQWILWRASRNLPRALGG